MVIDRRLHPEGFAEIEAAVFPSPWTANAFLSESNRRYFSIWDEGQPVAYLAACAVLDETELWRIAVLPQFRRRGLAQFLLHALIDSCKNEKGTVIFLEVSSRNTVAIRFYKKAGFLQDGCRSNYYGPGDDALLMRLPI